MRTIGNILIILFVCISVYSLRKDLTPVATSIGNYVENISKVLSDASSKGASTIPDETHSTMSQISTPGPLIVTTGTSTTPKPATGAASTGTGTTAAAPTGITKASILYWTNQARKDNGNLAALTENTTLDTTALAKTKDLFAKEYFEHTSPTGVTVATQADTAGYDYIMIGENLALGNFDSGKAIVDAWMGSPGHRANILQVRYTQIGVGVLEGQYQGRTVWIAVQHFGLPRSSCPIVEASLKNQIDINQTQIANLKNDIDAKKKQIDDSQDQYTYEYNQLVDQYNALINQYNGLVSSTKTEIANYNAEVNAYNACVKG